MLARPIGIMADGMTVLIGFIDSGDVILAADGYAYDGAKREIHDEWKTAKLNDRCCIGFSGLPYYGNQVLANLFGVSDWAQHTENIRIVRELENPPRRFRDDLDIPAVIYMLDQLCAAFLTRIEQAKLIGIPPDVPPFDVSFLVGAMYGGEPKLFVWSRQTRWQGIDVTCNQPVIFGPAGAEKLYDQARTILASKGSEIEKRVIDAVSLYADHPDFGDKVNKNITIRRASKTFELEILY